MKNNIYCLLIALLINISYSQAQNASKAWTYGVVPDSLSNVIGVKFNNQNKASYLNIWKLDDGELLYSDKIDAFGYSSRMLRYKMQDSDWKGRNIKIKQSGIRDETGGFKKFYLYNGEEFFTGDNVSFDASKQNVFNDVDNKRTLYKETVNEVTTLYSIVNYKDPKFNSSAGKYKNATKILSTKNIFRDYLYDAKFSCTGKYAFLPNIGIMIDLDKNKEVWNITKKNARNDYESFFSFAFSPDDSQIAIQEGEEKKICINIYNTKNGKKVSTLKAPDSIISKMEKISLYPASDMKSFVVHGVLSDQNLRETWLVKADGSTLKLDVNFD